MKNELRTVHNYFSHHMRNCTAMIAASVTLLSYRMTGDEQKLIDEVIEASFLLDLFDAGMDICFSHSFGAEPIGLNDDYDIEASILHFLDQCKTIMAEREIRLDLCVTDPCVVKGNAHELRTITNVIIYEMILQADKSIAIDLNKNCLHLSADAYHGAPEVWGVIKDVCKKRGIGFSFDNEGCTIEFAI